MYRLLTLLLFVPCILPAQTNHGTVIYKETLQLEYDEETLNSPFADRLPKERVRYMSLTYQGDSSLYEDITKEWMEANDIEPDNPWMLRWLPKASVYTDLGEEYVLRQREFLDKLFLIDESIRDREWKITMQPRSIMGYTTFQALSTDSSKTVEARFVPELPYYFGPENYFNLPGLVLAVNIDEGRLVIQAVAISFDPLEEGEIGPPKEGQAVSEEEFDQIVEDKIEEMKDAYGSRAGRYLQFERH